MRIFGKGGPAENEATFRVLGMCAAHPERQVGRTQVLWGLVPCQYCRSRSRLHRPKRQQASAVQGLRRQPGSAPFRFLGGSLLVVLGTFLGLMAPAHADFHDPMVHDKQWVFDYLDTIEDDAGREEFESVPFDRALRLAGTLGPIDRVAMTAEIFIA